MPTITGGTLEDDFALNLKALLDAGNIAESWGVADIQSVLPLNTNGPYPALFIQWLSSSEGDATAGSWPSVIHDVKVRARVVLVLAGMQTASLNYTNRTLLRKIADYISKNQTINGYCNMARVDSLTSGEELFANTNGYIYSDGAVELTATCSYQLTHSN